MRVGLVGCMAVLWFTACGGGPCPRSSISGFDIFTFLQDRAAEEDAPDAYGTAIFSIRPNGNALRSPAFSGYLRFSLFPSVQATQPCEKIFAENIVSISVRSSRDFDATHPAGTALNDLIRVRQHGFVSSSTSYHELPDILPVVAPGGDDYALSFYFAKRPDLHSEHRFQVQVNLDSGASYELETAAVDFSYH